MTTATSCAIDAQEQILILSGTGERPGAAALVGARARSEARLTGRGKTWKARFPLHVSRWGGPELPLPSGEYHIDIPGVDVDVDIPLQLLSRLRVEVKGDRLLVGPPLDPALESVEAIAAHERRYSAHTAPLENAVFFESFYGRVAGCNPLAIDREIARIEPGVTRYWSVVDHSVVVPDGAVALIEGSEEWWRARSASRLLVVNDWLRRRYTRRAGQRVLQTWHGTPLKRLALHRGGFAPRRWGAIVKESRRWDVLLAQNPYAARILSKAYAFLGKPVWTEGYPRNDVLTTGDDGATRRALGIAPEERVVIYAPTWRDDRAEIVDFIDPVELAKETQSVVLVRGHTRTLVPGRNVDGPRVIDVTGFADTSALLVAADALVTDYSSVMFDFSVTGKPMYFLVPDIERYRGELRGFYFDLVARAPGPLVRSQDELVAALARDPDEFAVRYDKWQARFNRREDGRASQRVVARIFDQGFLDRGKSS
ncbi:CDP-glycerol glycerophosphotransferase family protein [Microbacterium amylolyticum]|uniref:CDP-glycerol glycerophosphotransferase n=1 Tax=Microbacterium amylolyticum TaxID=936337 RepID=A0ABS4ZKI6_9MICO|nr:CDP-glycerol glycerophosphotransferase family protein [Microbacterium amylolyticum]MBP2437794.1 CDP-glycerol glycerophosphotransferase [Microbacterium amylolyticum]